MHGVRALILEHFIIVRVSPYAVFSGVVMRPFGLYVNRGNKLGARVSESGVKMERRNSAAADYCNFHISPFSAAEG